MTESWSTGRSHTLWLDENTVVWMQDVLGKIIKLLLLVMEPCACMFHTAKN